MANENFIKQAAMDIIVNNKSTEKYLFGDVQRTYIGAIIRTESMAAAYMAGAPITINEGSVTITWDQEDDIVVRKTGLGDGINTGDTATYVDLTTAKNNIAEPTKLTGEGANLKTNSGFNQKTFYYSDSFVKSNGFQKQDLMQGLDYAVAAKYAWATALFAKLREKNFFIAMAASFKATKKWDGTSGNFDGVISLGKYSDLFPGSAVAEGVVLGKVVAMKNHLSAAAAAMDRHEDSANAIMMGVTPFIDLDPVFFGALVDPRLMFANGKQVFEGGIATISEIGGFTVRSNPYIKNLKTGDTTPADQRKVVGFIATNIAAVSLLRFVVMNAGNLAGLSADQGYYVEAQFLGTGQPAAGAAKSKSAVKWFDTIIPGTVIALTVEDTAIPADPADEPEIVEAKVTKK